MIFQALRPPSSHVLNTNSADSFHMAFTTAQKTNMSIDDLLNTFNNTCKVELDSVASTEHHG